MPELSSFEQELQQLERHVQEMGDRVSEAILDATRALRDRDTPAARAVIASDEAINALWHEAQHEVMVIIARRQPLASDLREILACFAIFSDLERIGDHAKNIGRAVLELSDSSTDARALQGILTMSELCRQLLAQQIEAFLARDDQRARELSKRDAELDRLFEAAYTDCVEAMRQDPDAVAGASRLIGVAKGLERIGDHLTNIGEWAVFRQSGRLVELGP